MCRVNTVCHSRLPDSDTWYIARLTQCDECRVYCMRVSADRNPIHNVWQSESPNTIQPPASRASQPSARLACPAIRHLAHMRRCVPISFLNAATLEETALHRSDAHTAQPSKGWRGRVSRRQSCPCACPHYLHHAASEHTHCLPTRWVAGIVYSRRLCFTTAFKSNVAILPVDR